MAYRRTAYEITATKQGQPVYLVAYAQRLSRAGLLKAMQNRGEAIIARLGIGANDQITFHCQPRAHCVMDGWTIGFTGRTMLEAERSPHPYIGDVQAKCSPEVAQFIDPSGTLERAGLLAVQPVEGHETQPTSLDIVRRILGGRAPS